EVDDDIVVAQFGDGGDITINIGDVASNLDELGEDSANPPCILTSGHDVKVDLEKPIEVSLDEEEQNIRETKQASKKLSSLSAKRKLELDDTAEETPPQNILDDDINTASRPSGRPKQKESFKKATRSKDTTDILAYVDTVATVGDVTLKNLDEVLSIVVIGEALDGIRHMFNAAAFKRPKALVIKGNHSRSVESTIRFVLPANANVAQSIKEADQAQKLISFVEKLVIDDDHKEVERQRILHMIPFMYVDSAFSANGHNISFLNRESDTCVFLASLRVVKEAEPQTWQNPKYVAVVGPLYLQLSDVELRNQFIDTNDHIFTEMRSIRIVCCPTYVDIVFPHWCGIIFDMERKLCGIQEVISGVFVKLKTSHVEMPAKTFTRWRQCDGHNCGVLTMQWFEQYLSLVRSTSPDASIPLAHDDKLDPKQLAYERYKYF
ncbi:hypothetical protein GN958_ATG19808, partial [Phytophthora infestans]